ncbi:fibronectin type III domain-containing protein [Hymenobacter sp. H14-R3]|uniref:fibronectin type III domain-containing protein n=1 Tax=Hymenobacter sp. H14-R3 TaxID=3046308 RepID=UPI0024BBDB06|nr:T9SS type A sorting domain-containing protein [Hymenobacter sp. H14-R3]MDJ0363807.1 fibronectin type III domain-containing protein [Hymenobacter sp. H14-R3]
MRINQVLRVSFRHIALLLMLLSGAALAAHAQTPPPNDSLGRALPIACGQRLVASTAGARVANAPRGTCAGGFLGTPGLFYRFTAPTSGTYQASTCGAAKDFDTRLFAFDLYSGCLGGNDNAPGCGSASTLSFPATAGVQYYLFVTGTSPTATGAFELSLQCSFVDSVACVKPSGVRLTRLTDSVASVSFASVAGASGYQVTYQAAGGPVQVVAPAPPTPPVLLRGLRPGVGYTVSVSTICPPAPSQPTTTNSARATARLAGVLGVAAARTGAGILEVYPNPVTGGRLTWRLPAGLAAPAATVRLFNALGQTVLSQTLPDAGDAHTLAVRSLPAGLYTLWVQRADGAASSQRITLE